MRQLRWGMVSTGVLAMAGAWLGCGKGDESNPRYNEVIGGGAAPTGGRSDSGILQDPSQYKPAAVPGLAASGGAAAGDGGAAADSPEKAEVEKVSRAMNESLVAFNFSEMLDAINPEQVAQLKTDESESAARNATAALDLLRKEIKAKNADMGALLDEGLPKVATALTRSMEITVTDAEHATAKVNPEKLMAEFAALHKEMEPLLTKLGVPQAGADAAATPPVAAEGGATPPESPNGVPAGGMPPGAGMPMDPAAMQAMMGGAGAQETKFRNIGGAWKIDIGMTVSEGQAEVYREAMELIGGFATEATSRISSMPTLSPQSFHQVMAEAGQAVTMKAMALMGKFQTAMMEAAEDAAKAPPPAEGGDKPKPDEPAQPESGNPRVPNPRTPNP